MKTILLCSGVLSLIVCSCFAADHNVGVDGTQLSVLREQCGRRAAEFIERWKSCEGERVYRNHYNKKLNICFILIIAHCKAEEGGNMSGESLFDANNDRQYGRYVDDGEMVDNPPLQCYVGENTCRSLDKFRELIKPYLED